MSETAAIFKLSHIAHQILVLLKGISHTTRPNP
jgi:hypothetical protein